MSRSHRWRTCDCRGHKRGNPKLGVGCCRELSAPALAERHESRKLTSADAVKREQDDNAPAPTAPERVLGEEE